MKTAIICGKWEISFEEGRLGQAGSNVEKDPFLQRIFGERLEDVSSSTAAGCQLLSGLPQGKHIVEFYGGGGLQSVMVEKTLAPSRHSIVELDKDCFEHLAELMGQQAADDSKVYVHHGDAKEAMKTLSGDIYLLDWNTWTCLHHQQWKPYWDRLLATKPVAMSWYDTCKPYFHVNKKRYSEFLGAEINTFPEYTRALRSFMEREYPGYTIGKAVYCPRATYFLLVQQPAELEERTIVSPSGGFVWKP